MDKACLLVHRPAPRGTASMAPTEDLRLLTAASEPVASMSWFKAFCFVGTIVLVGVLLIFLQGILVPFTFAIFLAYLVRPLSEYISLNLCTCCCKRDSPSADAEEAGNIGLKQQGTIRHSIYVANVTVRRTLPRWVGVLLALVRSTPAPTPTPPRTSTFQYRPQTPPPSSPLPSVLPPLSSSCLTVAQCAAAARVLRHRDRRDCSLRLPGFGGAVVAALPGAGG